MASESITADMVREAGIAAQMALNPNAIPTPSIYAQDFTFGGTMFDAAFGNAEALSGVGSAVADVAAEERIKLEAKERKKDDPAGDASIIVELAEKQREYIAATYSNGQFHMNGYAIDEEDVNAEVASTLENYDQFADDMNLQGQQRGEVHSILVAIRAAENSPHEQTVLFNRLQREHPEVYDRVVENAHQRQLTRENNADVEIANRAQELNDAAPEVAIEVASTGTVEEQRAGTWQMEDTDVQREVLSRRGFASSQAEELVGWEANTADSIGAEFSVSASGTEVALVEADSTAAPSPQISPGLGQG